MSSQQTEDLGPDLSTGVTVADFGSRAMLRGHVGEDAVLLARVNEEFFAVGAHCTHYGAALDKGALVGDIVQCPLHHACFSVRTGEAVGAPAFEPLPRWRVIRDGERIRVTDAESASAYRFEAQRDVPSDIVIVGGGGAGFACAEMLRRRGYSGRLRMFSEEQDAPVDRPNLSKDFLAGTAPDEWMPLKPGGFYIEQEIDLRLAVRIDRIEAAACQLVTAQGENISFDRLLIATGAEPVRPPIAGADQDHVFALRSYSDSRAIIARAASSKTAVVLGSGFIGLEVAAALRERGLKVHVVSLESRPLGDILGPELGAFLQKTHELQGVRFHMGTSVASIGQAHVELTDGSRLPADMVILGIGVRPRSAIAEAAGLLVDDGIIVDAHMRTSTPNIYAAGDVARWTTGGAGESRRVEHWVVAERQGQVAAENMLGEDATFNDTPFFWSAHYDLAIRYAGYGKGWDRIQVVGNIEDRDCAVRYFRGDKLLAIAAIGRDQAVLEGARTLAGS